MRKTIGLILLTLIALPITYYLEGYLAPLIFTKAPTQLQSFTAYFVSFGLVYFGIMMATVIFVAARYLILRNNWTGYSNRNRREEFSSILRLHEQEDFRQLLEKYLEEVPPPPQSLLPVISYTLLNNGYAPSFNENDTILIHILKYLYEKDKLRSPDLKIRYQPEYRKIDISTGPFVGDLDLPEPSPPMDISGSITQKLLPPQRRVANVNS